VISGNASEITARPKLHIDHHETDILNEMVITNIIRDLREIHEDHENGLIFEKNVSIPLRNSDLPVRCNVYRPIGPQDAKYPVLVTYGPYGKDIPYKT
jgi:hypothetical protein